MYRREEEEEKKGSLPIPIIRIGNKPRMFSPYNRPNKNLKIVEVTPMEK